MLVLLAIHTVPIWDERGFVRVAGVDEVRHDLAVIGWAELMDVEIYGVRRRFYLS